MIPSLNLSVYSKNRTSIMGVISLESYLTNNYLGSLLHNVKKW